MNTLSDDTKRMQLEIEYSSLIAEKVEELVLFLKNMEITSLMIYLDREEQIRADVLLDFCKQIYDKNIACRVALNYGMQSLNRVLRSKNIKMRLLICLWQELKSFLDEKEDYPDVDVELYYDKDSADWHITEALELCRQNQVKCDFGCSDSYLSITSDKLKVICGEHTNTPYPGGCNCLRFKDVLFVAKDGTIFPCRGLRNLPVGNIFSGAIEEIIQNSTVLSFYNNYTQKIKAPCKDCSQFPSCAGCRGRAHRMTSDFLAADSMCPHNLSYTDQIAKLPVRGPEKYLPHKRPMLMVSELTVIHDNSCETYSTIQPDNPFVQKNKTLHQAAFIEIGAQSMAFLDTFLHPEAKLQGMLVEVTKFLCHDIPVYPGNRLRILCRKIYEMPPWNIGSFEIFSYENEIIATGEVKVCQFQDS